jgi:predicted transcriptional regulator
MEENMKQYKSLKYDKGFTVIKDIGKHEQTFGQDIQRRTNITFSHIIQLVTELSERKMINKKLEGRKQLLTLTEKGKKIYTIITELDKILQ